MAEIDLTPTEEMAANAARGLELRRKHGKGGTEIGVARARDISNRKNLSPETVRRMHAFFSRHEKNKAGGEDDAGYIAWLLWGGDSGQSWAKRKVEQMDKGENQRSDTYKEIAQRLGSAAKMGVQYVAPRSPVSKPERKYRVRLESRDTGKTIDFRTMATSDADARYQADAAYGKKWQILAVIEEHSRPGAKAKMNRPVVVDTWNAGHAVVTAELMPDHVGPSGVMPGSMWTGAITAKDRNGSIDRIAFTNPYKNMENAKRALMAEIAKIKASDMWRPRSKNDRPGAKAKFAKFNEGDTVVVPYGREMVRGKIVRYDAPGMFYVVDIGKYESIKVAKEDVRKASMSRPGAKAKFAAQVSGSSFITDDGKKFNISRWMNLSNASNAVQETVKRAAIVTDEKGKEWELKIYQNGSFVLRSPTAGGKRIEGKVASSRPGAKAEMSNHIRTVAEDKEASRRGLRRMIDQLESEWQSLNNQPSKAGRIPRMETIKKQIAGLEERLKSLSSRPGAKAKFAFKVGDRVHAGFGVAGGAGVIGTITKIEDGYAHIQGDASALDRYGPKTYKARLDRLTAPPKKAWESSKNAVREGEKISASDDAVSRKIRKLMDEGKPQKQAVAIALDLERRGEL